VNRHPDFSIALNTASKPWQTGAELVYSHQAPHQWSDLFSSGVCKRKQRNWSTADAASKDNWRRQMTPQPARPAMGLGSHCIIETPGGSGRWTFQAKRSRVRAAPFLCSRAARKDGFVWSFRLRVPSGLPGARFRRRSGSPSITLSWWRRPRLSFRRTTPTRPGARFRPKPGWSAAAQRQRLAVQRRPGKMPAGTAAQRLPGRPRRSGPSGGAAGGGSSGWERCRQRRRPWRHI